MEGWSIEQSEGQFPAGSFVEHHRVVLQEIPAKLHNGRRDFLHVLLIPRSHVANELT